MNTITAKTAAILCSYLLGAVPIGYLVFKLLRNEDIRQYGSGNIGATNIGRLLGMKWAAIVYFLDVLKGFLPCFVVGLLVGHKWGTTGMPALVALCGLAAIVGHNWPVYLRFRGGKGVSTTCGAFLYVFPLGVAVGVVIWAIAFALTRYVSVASMCAAAALLISAFLSGPGRYVIIFALVATAMLVFRHKTNITRLLKGTEVQVGEESDTPTQGRDPE